MLLNDDKYNVFLINIKLIICKNGATMTMQIILTTKNILPRLLKYNLLRLWYNNNEHDMANHNDNKSNVTINIDM